MTVMQKFEFAKNKLELAREECKTLMKDAFDAGCRELFQEHEVLRGFSWTQYTPYFNDGDECVFSVHTDYPNIWFGEFDDEELYEGDYEFSRWDARENPDKPESKAGLAVIEFLQTFDDDLLKDAFGDHVEITVTRDGGIIVDDCEHD